jgi:hypothetical protein
VHAPCDGSFSNPSGNKDIGVTDQFLPKNKPGDDSKRELPLMDDKGSPLRKSADSKKAYRQMKTIGTENANKCWAKVPMGYEEIHPIVILAPSKMNIAGECVSDNSTPDNQDLGQKSAFLNPKELEIRRMGGRFLKRNSKSVVDGETGNLSFSEKIKITGSSGNL